MDWVNLKYKTLQGTHQRVLWTENVKIAGVIKLCRLYWENSDLEKNLFITLNHLEVNFCCSALGNGQMLPLSIKREDKQVDGKLIIHYECKV